MADKNGHSWLIPPIYVKNTKIGKCLSQLGMEKRKNIKMFISIRYGIFLKKNLGGGGGTVEFKKKLSRVENKIFFKNLIQLCLWYKPSNMTKQSV